MGGKERWGWREGIQTRQRTQDLVDEASRKKAVVGVPDLAVTDWHGCGVAAALKDVVGALSCGTGACLEGEETRKSSRSNGSSSEEKQRRARGEEEAQEGRTSGTRTLGKAG